MRQEGWRDRLFSQPQQRRTHYRLEISIAATSSAPQFGRFEKRPEMVLVGPLLVMLVAARFSFHIPFACL